MFGLDGWLDGGVDGLNWLNWLNYWLEYGFLLLLLFLGQRLLFYHDSDFLSFEALATEYLPHLDLVELVKRTQDLSLFCWR